MTTVLAVRTDTAIIMAADTQANDDSNRPWRDEKIRRVGQFLIGASGDISAGDTAMHRWIPPEITDFDRRDLRHFMIATVVPSLRTAMAEHYVKSQNSNGWALLLATEGEIFHIEDDFSVISPLFDAGAIGSGGPYALGAYRGGASVEKAMEVAAENDPWSSAPFMYLSLPIL